MDGSPPDKRLLKRVEAALLPKTLDGEHLSPGTLPGQDQTGVDGSTVQQNGAGAAFPDPASLLGSGEAKFIPEQIEKPESGVYLQAICVTVDGKFNLNSLHGKPSFHTQRPAQCPNH
jgi:hypothetical protein